MDSKEDTNYVTGCLTLTSVWSWVRNNLSEKQHFLDNLWRITQEPIQSIGHPCKVLFLVLVHCTFYNSTRQVFFPFSNCFIIKTLSDKLNPFTFLKTSNFKLNWSQKEWQLVGCRVGRGRRTSNETRGNKYDRPQKNIYNITSKRLLLLQKYSTNNV